MAFVEEEKLYDELSSVLSESVDETGYKKDFSEDEKKIVREARDRSVTNDIAQGLVDVIDKLTLTSGKVVDAGADFFDVKTEETELEKKAKERLKKSDERKKLLSQSQVGGIPNSIAESLVEPMLEAAALWRMGVSGEGVAAIPQTAAVWGGTEYAVRRALGDTHEQAMDSALVVGAMGKVAGSIKPAGESIAKALDPEKELKENFEQGGSMAGGGKPPEYDDGYKIPEDEFEYFDKDFIQETLETRKSNQELRAEALQELDPVQLRAEGNSLLDREMKTMQDTFAKLDESPEEVIISRNKDLFEGVDELDAYEMLRTNTALRDSLKQDIEDELFARMDKIDFIKRGDDRIEIGAKSELYPVREVDSTKAEQLAMDIQVKRAAKKQLADSSNSKTIASRKLDYEKVAKELMPEVNRLHKAYNDNPTPETLFDLEEALRKVEPQKDVKYTSIAGEDAIPDIGAGIEQFGKTMSKEDVLYADAAIGMSKKGTPYTKTRLKQLEEQQRINEAEHKKFLEDNKEKIDRINEMNANQVKATQSKFGEDIQEVDLFKDSRIAQTKDGKIQVRKDITQKDVLKHIQDSSGDEIGKQKSAVTLFMRDKYGIDLVDTIKKMNDDEAKRFVLEHERAHIVQDEAFKKKGSSLKDEYFKNKTAREKYLTEEAIKLEAQANLIALEKLGKIKLNRKTKKKATQDKDTKKLEDKSAESKPETPTKPKEVEEIEKLEERVEGLRERAKKLFEGTKTNWKASYRNDGVYGTYQEIHRMTRDALNEAARAGRNATDFIEKAMKSSGFKKGDGFDKGFYKSILSTDYQSIKEFKTQRQASKFLQDNKELYLEVKKYVDQTAKGIRDKGHMNNVDFSNSGYMITIRAGIDAKYADTIDKLISVKAMSNEDWDFIEKYKGTTAFKEMLSMSYELKQQSKKLFENNRHAEMKGYQSELYDSIYRYDMVDGKFVKKIDTEVGMVQGGLPQRLDNSRTGEIIQYPKYVQKMDNDLKEMYAMSNNLGVVFDMYGNPKALRKVANEKQRLEIGKSNLASDVLPLTYENSTRKLLQIDGVINKIRNTEDNNLFSSTEKEGMELLSEEELKGIPTELHEKVRYVNKDFKQMLLGNKQIQVASGDMTKILEQVLKDSVTHFKENVVLKNPASWLNNMGYNYFVNLQNGISPVKTTQMMKRGLREKKAAENMMKAVTALELSGKAGSPQHKALLKKLEDNLYYKLDREGMAVTVMSNIIDSPIASKRFSDKAMKQMLTNLVGKDKADKISNVVANMYLSPQSKLGQHAMNMFGSIDAMGRYTLALDAIEKGASHADAIKKANSIYGDLDMIAPKWSQAIQQYGFIPFSNWYFRMSGGLARNILDNKMKAIGVAALLYGISEVSDKRTDSMNPLTSLVTTPSEMLQMTPYLNVDNYAKNVVTPSVYKKTARAVETGDPVSVVLSREY